MEYLGGLERGRRRVLAWGSSLLVLVCGLTAWLAAMTDQDRFATRALSVAVIVAFVASLPGWAIAKRVAAFVAFSCVRIALFFWLAPAGVRSIALSYGELDEYAYFDDWLIYFWALPPLLLLVSVVESWALDLSLSGRTLRQTKLWRLRRPLAIGAAVSAAVALAWWFGRVEWYVRRLRQHDAPASYALAKVGPRALPRIYREIHSLGSSDVGRYRSDLVDVIVDIQHDVVARRIRSPLIWEVEATLVDVDSRMLDALATAFTEEPSSKELDNMCNWASELDFDTQIDLFCSVFTRLPDERRWPLVHMIASSVKRATDVYDPAQRPGRSDPSYPWAKHSKTEIEQIQARMRSRLACVPPFLVELLERQAPGFGNDAPLGASESVRMLGKLAPLPDGLGSRMGALLPRIRDGYLTTVVLEQLAREIARDRKKPEIAIMEQVYRSQKSARSRESLLMWIREKGRSHGIAYDAFFCRTFSESEEEQRYTELLWLQSAATPDPCVAPTLMAAFEQVVSRPTPPPWSHSAESWLSEHKPSDPRISSWARELQPKLEKRKRYRLDSLL